MLTNENNWAPPEPAPAPITEPILKPTPKKRGIIYLSPEDMQEGKKSIKEKGMKAEELKIYLLLKKYMGLIHHHCLRWQR